MSAFKPGSPEWDRAIAKIREMLARSKISKDEFKKASEEVGKIIESSKTVGGPRPNQAARIQQIRQMQGDLGKALNEIGVRLSGAGQTMLPNLPAFTPIAATPVVTNSAFLGRAFNATRGAGSMGYFLSSELLVVTGGYLAVGLLLCWSLNEAYKKITKPSDRVIGTPEAQHILEKAVMEWLSAYQDFCKNPSRSPGWQPGPPGQSDRPFSHYPMPRRI